MLARGWDGGRLYYLNFDLMASSRRNCFGEPQVVSHVPKVLAMFLLSRDLLSGVKTLR
jgi:hypothetical protein